MKISFYYNVCLENGWDQLVVTLYTLFIYPSVHKQLNRTLFEAHNVPLASQKISIYAFLLSTDRN